MRRYLLALLFVATSLSTAFSQAFLPSAGFKGYYDYCTVPTEPPETIIRNCTGALRFEETSDNNEKVDPIFVAQVLYSLAKAHVRQGDGGDAAKEFDLAIAASSESLTKNPGNANALNFRCFARGVAGKEFDEALADCEAALKLVPNSPRILDSIAFLSYRQQRYQEALDNYNAVLKIKGDRANTLFMRGVVKIRLGDLSGATADINAARALNPDVDTIFAGYGIKVG